MEWKGYTNIAWKARSRNSLIRPIKQAVKHIITVINLLHVGNWLKWWSKDQSWKKDSNREGWFLLFDEFPNCLLRFGFGHTVGDIRVLGFDCIVNCELSMSAMTDGNGRKGKYRKPF